MSVVDVPSNEELSDMLLHQRIRKTREGLQLTQAKFGHAVGVSERQVKRWEAATSIPEPENGRSIAELADRRIELFIVEPDEAVYLIPAGVLEEIRSRLAALEVGGRETVDLTREALELLRATRQLGREAHEAHPRASD